jgi:NAD(P)-dependent dehydrogenase (short-subunit alcohol dehydrogenase family)
VAWLPGCVAVWGSWLVTAAGGVKCFWSPGSRRIEASIGRGAARSGYAVCLSWLQDVGAAAAGEPDRSAPCLACAMGRIADLDEIAAAVLWLLSDESSYVAVPVLRVSGGVGMTLIAEQLPFLQ